MLRHFTGDNSGRYSISDIIHVAADDNRPVGNFQGIGEQGSQCDGFGCSQHERTAFGACNIDGILLVFALIKDAAFGFEMNDKDRDHAVFFDANIGLEHGTGKCRKRQNDFIAAFGVKIDDGRFGKMREDLNIFDGISGEQRDAGLITGFVGDI